MTCIIINQASSNCKFRWNGESKAYMLWFLQNYFRNGIKSSKDPLNLVSEVLKGSWFYLFFTPWIFVPALSLMVIPEKSYVPDLNTWITSCKVLLCSLAGYVIVINIKLRFQVAYGNVDGLLDFCHQSCSNIYTFNRDTFQNSVLPLFFLHFLHCSYSSSL